MPDGKQIKLTPAKGRPMLTWVGKKPLQRVTAFPAQLVERFAPAPEASGEGLIFHGDNKDVLAWLLANGYRGKVDLVYIDPPFDSGADYVRKVELRGGVGSGKLEGETHSLGEQIQYTDIWANDNYLQFMYERLLLLKELLTETGGIWLHCDPSRNYILRSLLDEVFGQSSFQNEIIWQRQTAHSDSKTFGFVHDTIYWYTKSPLDFFFDKPHIPYSKEYLDSHYSQRDENGKPYTLRDLNAPRGQGPVYEFRGITRPWRFTKENMLKLEAEGRIYQTEGKIPRLKVILENMKGMPVQDIWEDINPLNSQAIETVSYPTQKPEALLTRIIQAASYPGDLILDCYVGSGTTAAVAQKLGRRWIIADINKGAVQTASKRLQRIISEQIETTKKQQAQPALVQSDADESPRPAQLGFSIYRVNDYDLQIQHNEALNLAIEHIGIERLKGDPFFDGTLGKQLAKVIPFNHPLTRLDLQLIQDEINTRSGEERDIVVVCLGKEIAVDNWLAEYNHKHPVNKIKVIELRTDPKYGKFFEHHPASAEVQVKREGDKIRVEIVDFISPTILERLEMDAGLFAAKITDWRAMVDTVLIDLSYDGEVFNVALSDVPERKADLVLGTYELPAPAGETRVAVKIIDMLGEEVLVVQKV